jgi:regulatory protein
VAARSNQGSRTTLQRAVALLARREYSRAELAGRLARDLSADDDRAEIERVLDQLAERGMLSDARFAAALTRARAQRFGSARIRQELKQRGVSAELLSSSVAELESTELERARQVWRRRFGTAPANAAERARQMRFLAQRGFETSVIVRVIGRSNDADD